ncbi:MAG: hypothetical protein WA988_05980 [Candidatus Nanopelagicales bacterium]
MTTATVPSAFNIRPKIIIVVEGTVEFARTASLIQGAELERRVRNSPSQFPNTMPHTTITLSQPKIIQADPAQIGWEEAFVRSSFFEYRKNPEKGFGFEAQNLTRNLPTLLAVDPENPGSHRQIVNVEGEIAKGTIVRLVLSTFQSKDDKGKPRAKLGVGLEAIILSTAEVPYAPKAGPRNLDLSSYGITFSEPLIATKGVESETRNDIVGTDESGLPAAPVQPAAQQQPAAPTAPVQPAVQQQPAAPVQQQPAAPTAPVQPAVQQPTAPVAPIVPISTAYQVPGPVQPAQQAAPGVANPADPFAGEPAPSWGGTGISLPA